MGFNNERMGCVRRYAEDLKNYVPSINSLYDGYLKNFNAEGNLVNTNWTSLNKKAATI